MHEQEERLGEIFMPHAARKKKALLDKRGRLVHYTTAENALNIIKTHTIWLRNALGMHDYSEVQHGFSQIKEYLHQNESGNLIKFNGIFENCFKDAVIDGIKLFDQWWSAIQNSTYIGCFSEHTTEENEHGRLSMWRAFGKNTAAVAIVLKFPDPHSAIPLKVFLSPVAYFKPDELDIEFNQVMSNIESNLDFIKTLPRETVVGTIYVMLMMATVSLKHPGFHEEREWRLIHNPAQFSSLHVLTDTKTIGGVPQIIHKVILENKPDEQITNISLSDLLDRVIIGPSQYSFTIWESLVKELGLAGVAEAHNKVFISGIPLRAN